MAASVKNFDQENTRFWRSKMAREGREWKCGWFKIQTINVFMEQSYTILYILYSIFCIYYYCYFCIHIYYSVWFWECSDSVFKIEFRNDKFRVRFPVDPLCLGKAFYPTSFSSTQAEKMSTSTAGELTCDGLTSHPGGVMLLSSACIMETGDKHRIYATLA